MPKKTEFPNDSFDIGLSSHFLLLYSALGRDFHLQSIKEILRICKEIRIFPTCDLDGKKSDLLSEIFDCYENTFNIKIIKTGYEFQKDGNEMLLLTKF